MLDERFQSLVQEPSPAVLTTYRRDGSALTSPVWFRQDADALEVVVARGDVKLAHLSRHPQCTLTVFEAVPPFRGLQIDAVPELLAGDVTNSRLAIARRYLGAEDGARFAAQRDPNGTRVRLPLAAARVWDLSAILPRG
jgi:Pyridoxamine 5'-phosphate oxidase